MEKGKKDVQTVKNPDERLKPSTIEKIINTRKDQIREGNIIQK
jgi:hypothetical protein